MAIASMTGHGVGRVELGALCVVAEIRALNHRGLDVRVRAPEELEALLVPVEAAVRASLVRGRVEVSLTLEGERPRIEFDVARVREAIARLQALRDELAPGEPLPFGVIASLPGVLVAKAPALRGLDDAVLRAVRDASADLDAMRRREGERIAADMSARLSTILELVARIEARGPVVIENARERLRERLSRLMGPIDSPETGRIEQEIAILVDRADVAEECTRLRSHVEEARRVLSSPEPTKGKRLDFLAQELAREASTIGHKSADAEIAARVVDLKVEIDRIREQAQNVL